MISEEKLQNNIITKINILSLSEIQSDSKYVDCNFLFECIYDESLEEVISYMIENCVELYSIDEICCTFIDGNKKKKIWNYKAKIRVLNNTVNIPYNSVYLLIKMVLKEYYCNDTLGNEISIESGKCINNHYRDKLKSNYIIIPKNSCSICYIWTYNFYNIEHIIKYMIIPTLLTILLQLTHRLKVESKVDYVSIVATLLLSDIALLFTIPETNTLIASEKIIYINIGIKIFIGMFAFYDLDVEFGENIFPGLKHHGIDIIINIITIVLILVLILQTLYKALKEHKTIKNIFKKCEISKSEFNLDFDCYNKNISNNSE